MARIPDTEIERLKSEVSVERLVEAAGIELKRGGKDLLIAAQPVDASRQNRPGYDECASGPIIYSYVEGKPNSMTDLLGLRGGNATDAETLCIIRGNNPHVCSLLRPPRPEQPRACECPPQNCPEWQYTVGIGGSAGGIGSSRDGGPAFVGGGVAVGVTSSGTIIGQVQAAASTRAQGAYGGISFQWGASRSDTRTPTGQAVVSTGTQLDLNLGLGRSGGGSAQIDAAGNLTGLQGGFGRSGFGVGYQVSTSDVQTVTWAIPTPWTCTCAR